MRKLRKVPRFDEYSSKLVERLESSGHYGTAQTYLKTRRSFMRYMEAYGSRYVKNYGDRGILMSQISSVVIDGYNQYLRELGLVRNTISFYNRVLRAMYNKAVREYNIENSHPFSGVYTGVDRTSSRAICERSMASMMSLDMRENSTLSLSRDMFMFSYVMRGMPFVDMVYLKRSQINGSCITYTRRKTGATLRVRIEGEAARIISKYRVMYPKSEYLFPILERQDDTRLCCSDRKHYSRYCSALSIYNRNLKKLSSMAGIHERVSSYVARHSWASAARNIGSGMSVISAALGHNSEHTTRIYLSNLDSTLIDHANNKLVIRLRKYASNQKGQMLQIPIVSMKETNSDAKV